MLRYPKDGFRTEPIDGLAFNLLQVVDIKWFSQLHIRQFSARVDATQMIMTQRWGDAPLRFVTLSLYATAAQILCFGPMVDYYHNGPQNRCDLAPNLPGKSPAGCNVSTVHLWTPLQRQAKFGGYGGQVVESKPRRNQTGAHMGS